MSTLRLNTFRTSPIIATGLALAACYGTLALTLLLPAIGIPFAVSEGPWAITIVTLTLLALVTFALRAHRHKNWKPFALAALGAVVVSWVMFVSYHQLIEITAFALLIAAAILVRRVTA